MFWPKSKELKKEFEEQLLEHMDALYHLALQMTWNKEDASDLVQETSLKGFRFFHKFEQGTNFKAWILTILRNTYINQYRKKVKEPAKVDFDEVQEFISLPEMNGVGEEIFGEAVQTSMDTLPDELRTTITLFYVEELSYKEIAQVMDCPMGTVMSRLYAARQALKKTLLKKKEKTHHETQ